MEVAGARRLAVGDNERMSDRPPSGATRSLIELLGELEEGLVRAVVDAKHEWHLPVVATVDAEGMPQARTVVLRGFERSGEAPPRLRFHTDTRSGKIAEIARDDRIGMLFYERRHKVQLRIEGRAVVHVDDEIADAAWAATNPSSRRCYLAPHPPSSALGQWDPNLPEAWRGALPDGEASEPGRSNFAVVKVNVRSIDRLELHHDGHVRSRWRWADDGSVESTWLAP